MPTGRDDYTGSVIVTGSVTISAPVQITGTVTITGTVSISNATIAVTQSGSWTINVSGTVNITGPVTISTLAADNIIIDLFKQGAVTERRSTLSNDGNLSNPSWSAATGATWYAKYFPRGCRGWISRIGIYAKNEDAAQKTITIKLYPYPEGPLVASYTVTIAGSASAAWVYATIDDYWKYDSILIVSQADDSDVYFGYDDAPTTPDAYYSSDSLVTFSSLTRRYYARLEMMALTVGDLCVTGIVNTIPIPNTTGTISHPSNSSINGGTTADLLATIYGAGELLGLSVFTRQNVGSTVTDADQHMGMVIDGTAYEIKASDIVSIYQSTIVGSAAPFVLLKADGTLNIYCWAITQRIPFQRSLRIYARNGAASGQYMTAEIMLIYTLLR